VAGEQTLALAPVVIDEVTILGSRCGPFDRALTALDTGEVDVLPMISARYSLDQESTPSNTLDEAVAQGPDRRRIVSVMLLAALALSPRSPIHFSPSPAPRPPSRCSSARPVQCPIAMRRICESSATSTEDRRRILADLPGSGGHARRIRGHVASSPGTTLRDTNTTSSSGLGRRLRQRRSTRRGQLTYRDASTTGIGGRHRTVRLHASRSGGRDCVDARGKPIKDNRTQAVGVLYRGFRPLNIRQAPQT
jgi:hypothetical protein